MQMDSSLIVSKKLDGDWERSKYNSMKERKNRLDEMQEQKMLHIEHNGFWIGYIGLAIAILAQILYYGPGCFEQMGGELLVFMCLSVYTMAGCIKYGVWDRKFAPSGKVNMYASLIAGVIGGVFYFFVTFFRYHTWQGCAAAGFVMGVGTFICTLLCMTLLVAAYKQRERKLESEYEEDGEEMKK